MVSASARKSAHPVKAAHTGLAAAAGVFWLGALPTVSGQDAPCVWNAVSDFCGNRILSTSDEYRVIAAMEEVDECGTFTFFGSNDFPYGCVDDTPASCESVIFTDGTTTNIGPCVPVGNIWRLRTGEEYVYIWAAYFACESNCAHEKTIYYDHSIGCDSCREDLVVYVKGPKLCGEATTSDDCKAIASIAYNPGPSSITPPSTDPPTIDTGALPPISTPRNPPLPEEPSRTNIPSPINITKPNDPVGTPPSVPDEGSGGSAVAAIAGGAAAAVGILILAVVAGLVLRHRRKTKAAAAAHAEAAAATYAAGAPHKQHKHPAYYQQQCPPQSYPEYPPQHSQAAPQPHAVQEMSVYTASSAAGTTTTSSGYRTTPPQYAPPVSSPPVPTKSSGGDSDIPPVPPVGPPVGPPMPFGVGAVGTAAAVPKEVGVATSDSVSNYATNTHAALPQLQEDATTQEKKQRLEMQLDRLIGKVIGECLLVLAGTQNRLGGGQAVVQIVEDVRTKEQHAVKFFLSVGAFRQEHSLYMDPSQPLGRFLPQMLRIAEGSESGMRDSEGAVMAPCIVMEKGEALDVWIEKSGEKIDMFTSLQVLSHIAERLKDLHAAGYVHRDIKPGNIMWLPRKKRWTLIDFGCAARTGTHAPTGFSLFYVAPEALHAYTVGAGGVVATEALDAWSLGVLAIEMFNGKSVIDHMQPKEHTMDMILGKVAAPWEYGEAARNLLRPLGIFKPAVLGLLRRDPAQRTTIQSFLDSSRRALANTSVTAT